MMNKTILLTGARAPITLDLARHFFDHGDTVILADSTRFPLSRSSKSIVKFILLPKPNHCPLTYVQFLNRVCEENSVDILIPTCEEIFYISRFKDKITAKTSVFCDDFNKLVKLHDKWLFNQSVLSTNIKGPESILLSSLDDFKNSNFDLTDWVFKPVFSRFAARTLISPTLPELQNMKINQNQRWIAQKRIHGKEYSSYNIAFNGKLTAHACYYSHYRAGKGAGIYFEAIDHPKIMQFVQQYVTQQQFHGQISFDFIEEDNGDCYVIECNPRATSGVHLIVDNHELRNRFFHPEIMISPENNTPSRRISLAMFIYALPKIKSFGMLKKLYFDFKKANDVTFDKKDILPSFYQYYSLFNIFIKSIIHHKTMMEIATSDIEYNGQSL